LFCFIWAPLHFAAHLNDVQVIRLLLGHGASVDIRGAMGETPLLVAVIEGHYHSVAELLKAGADPNLTPTEDSTMTPIQLAVRIGSKEIMSLLLHNNADASQTMFSQARNATEMELFVVNEEWKEDDWDPEIMGETQSLARKEDVLEFDYPECPQVDVSRRYVNPDRVKELHDPKLDPA
jgi:hypothetical protein